MNFKPSGPKAIIDYLMFSILIGVGYFYIAKLSLILTIAPGQSSAFFMPSGLGIALLVVFGIRYLPVLFLSKFLLSLSMNRGLDQNLVSCLATVAEAYIGYFLYFSFKKIIEEKLEYQSKSALITLIACCAPIFSSLIGVTGFLFLGFLNEDAYFGQWLNWYTGDLLGILVFMPLIVSLKETKHRPFDFVAPVLAGLTMYAFKFEFLGPYVFFIFLALLIPALLGSILGLYYAVVVIASVANYFQIKNMGPFSYGNYVDNMVSMQFFLMSLAITALSIEGFKKTKLLRNAVIPLISFWFIAGAIYGYFYLQQGEKNHKIVHDTTTEFHTRLMEKMDAYENAIKSAAGFVASSVYVDQDEWKEYALAISIVNEENGTQGLGIVYPENTPIKTGIDHFYPEKEASHFQLKSYLKDPVLKPTFDESMYSRKPMLSAPRKIKQETFEKELSFLISPVYKNEKFLAWIVIPVNLKMFFESIIKHRYSFIDVDIFDGGSLDESQKVYSKVVDPKVRKGNLDTKRLSTFTMGERTFTIDWNETHRYIYSNDTQDAFIIFLSAVFSAVVTGFILNLRLINFKATRIAGKRTIELKESEEKFKSLFHHSSDAVILFNNQEMLDCNPESLKIFGKTSKRSLLMTPIDDLFMIRNIDSLVDDELFKKKQKEVQENKMVHFECFCQRGGLPFFAEIHLHYLEVNEDFIYQAVVRDISERKKMENNLTRLKDLAEETARAKSNFLSTMSHEMRTPLNGVIGMINIILDENPKSEIREDLETIKYSADNLLHIVNEVLDYNKIESGKVVLEKKSFSLRELCENIIKIHRPKALEKNLKIIINIAPEIPETVIGDEYRNGQILNNLLSNALKFTEVGEVELSLSLTSLKNHSCVVKFAVRDTGMGISQDKIATIFEDFTQAENDHTRKFGGTGLGLAITKRLIEIQNGSISVASVLNKGSVFSYMVELSLEGKTHEAWQEKIQDKAFEFSQRQKVLLVEDNQINILVTKKFLEKWGLDVDVAMNGLAAVDAVKNTKYALVLMDLHMPMMDGFEATKRIRIFDTATPIVGLSADVMTESVSSLQLIGMNDFVTKPFKPSEFYDKLRIYIQ